MRTAFYRVAFSLAVLAACILGFGMDTAFASHFRGGTISWVRLPDPSATEYAVQLTFSTGYRWSYPYGQFSGVEPNYCLALPASAGFVATQPVDSNPQGDGACPPLGSVQQLGGGNTAGFITFNKSVEVGTDTTMVTSTPHLATIVQVIPALDTMYAEWTEVITFPKTSNPVTATFTDSARLNALLDGNANTMWDLQAVIDVNTHLQAGSDGQVVSHSPESASQPLIYVNTGVVNSLQIPMITFDNMSAKLSIAPVAQSLLVTPEPPGMTLSTTTPGLLTFTPPTDGLYSVQFNMTSYDTNGVQRNQVPLEVLFSSSTCINCASVALSSPSTIYTTNVNQQLTATVTATASNLSGSGWTTLIVNGPALPGMTIANVAGASGTSTSTITWTPTLNSTAGVVCFQGVVQNATTSVASAQSLCLNFYIGALQTTLVAYPASGAGGGPLGLSAKLTRTLDNAPLPNELISFALVSNPTQPLATAITDNTGTATAIVITSFVAPTGVPYQATFNAVANQFLQASSSQNVIVIKAATTAINSGPAPGTNPYPTLGFPSTLSVLLSRIFTDGGIIPPPGESVTFTITPPGNAPPITVNGLTDATGTAVATFTPTVAGTYSAVASFAGNALLFGADTTGAPAVSPTTTFEVGQRLQLASAPATGSIGVPLTVNAILTQIPQGTPVAGDTVTFTFPGGTPATQTAITNSNGVATATSTFAAAGTPSIKASYSPQSGELNDAGLNAAEITSANATINASMLTTLAAIAGSTPALVGNPLTFSTTLATTGGAIANATVTFSVTGPASFTFPATTNLAGQAAATFTPALRGVYQVTANFAGSAGLLPSTANTFTVTAYQPALLTAAATAAALPGQPTTLNAILTTPGGTPISGESVGFSFGGSSPAPQTAQTNASGVASVTVTFATPGPYTATASFSDSVNYFTNRSGAVPPAPETTGTAVTVALDTPVVGISLTGSSNYGASTTLTATVNPMNGGPIPTGSVTFQFTNSGGTVSYICSDGTVQTQSCSVPLNATGTASVVTANLPAGADNITTSYSGDVDNSPEQSALTVTVSQDTTQVALTISPSSPAPTYGDTLTLSMLVSDNTQGTLGTPTGTAQFAYSTDSVNWTNLGSAVTLDPTGAAQVQTAALPAGSPTVRVNYSGDSNFTASTAMAVQPVNAKVLTVAGFGAQNKTYDGGTTAALNAATATLVGVVSGDNVALVTTGGTGTFSDKNVGTGKTVTVSGLTLSGTSSTNYSLTQPSASADISPAGLIVSAAGVAKTYDGTASAMVTLSDNRVATGDNLVDNYGAASFSDKNVGLNKPVSVSGIKIGGADAGNYTANTTASTTANITVRPLIVAASASNKVYDGTTAAVAALADNRVGGDVFTDSYAGASFAQADAGAGIVVTVNGISIAGADAGNYSFNATASTTANITAANAGFSVNPTSATYGQSVVLSVTVTPVSQGMVPGGTVTFSFTDSNNVVQNICGDGTLSTTACPVTLDSNGNGSVTTTNLPPGAADGVTVAYQPSGVDYQSGMATITASISKANTLASVSKSVDPTIYGQGVTLSGTVTDNTVGSTKVPTGSAALSFTVPNTTTIQYICSDGSISSSSCSVPLDTTGSYSVPNITALPAGVYNITAGYSGDTDFVAANANIPQTINALNLTVAGLTANNKTYDGGTSAPLNAAGAVLVGVIPGDTVTLVTTGAAGAFSDKNVGTGKTVTVSGLTLSGASSTNYSLTQPTASANISSATLTVSAAGTNKTYDGTTTATVTLSDNRVSGDNVTDAYGSAAFTSKTAGTGKTVNVAGIAISGDDAGNYSANTATSTTANILTFPLAVTATGANKVYNGTTTATVTLADNRIAGDVFTDSYASAGFASANAGSAVAITVSGITISGTDAANYTSNTTASASANITVASSAINWSNPAAITYGTALSGTQLNATANGNGSTLAGTFVYSPAVGALLSAGNSQVLSVSFTPADTTDFTPSTARVQINVQKATPTVSWPAPAAITYPAPLSAAQLDATASVPGTFVYSRPGGTVLAAGLQPLSVTFAPTDQADYNGTAASVQLTVQKGGPVISWPAPANITNPAPLSTTQLDATASVPGTFVYTPAKGTVLSPGTQSLSVVFTPTDTLDYTAATTAVSITVNSNGNLTIGAGQTVSFTNGTLSGNVTLSPNSTLVLNQSKATGNVTVDNGATLVLNDSTVDQNVQVQAGGIVSLQNGSIVDQNLQMQQGGTLTTNGGTIQQNLQISGAATFSLNGTTVDQSVQIQNVSASSAQNQVCGVHTLANLQVENNASAILVGSGSSCAGNTVAQNLQVQNNTAPVTVDNNTVANNLQVQNNATTVSVFDNKVSNDLQCSGNTAITAGGNTAQRLQGQCVAPQQK